jgi:prepilin-type N-terminal cleavage/methylation domain-containing protein
MTALRNSRVDDRDRSGGFTLVEIIIAIALFGIGVLALAAVMPMGINRNNKAGQLSRASELVAARAEQFLATPYTEPGLAPGTHDDPGNPYEDQYHVRWTVEEDQPIAYCKRVTIQVNCPSLTSPATAKTVIVLSQAGN